MYSSYDASMLVRRGTASKVVGVAALAAQGETDQVELVTSYEEGLTVFGADGEGQGMAEILRLLFLNGVTAVRAVRAADAEHYQDAFDLLSMEEDIQVVVCDSGELTVQQLLRTSLESASAARRERIGVVGSVGEETAALITRAEGLNSERIVLVGPDVTDQGERPSAACLPQRRWRGPSPQTAIRRCPSTARDSRDWGESASGTAKTTSISWYGAA